MRILYAIATLFVLVSFPVWTARTGTVEHDFRKGLAAFNTGDYATALRLWRPLAEREEPRSEAAIGFMYHRGLGVETDDRGAALWLRRAAEHGQPEGQLMLGILFYYGRGVPRSYVRAYAWCELAEINGNADATLCREAALESMSDTDREEAFDLAVDLRERYGPRR